MSDINGSLPDASTNESSALNVVSDAPPPPSLSSFADVDGSDDFHALKRPFSELEEPTLNDGITAHEDDEQHGAHDMLTLEAQPQEQVNDDDNGGLDNDSQPPAKKPRTISTAPTALPTDAFQTSFDPESHPFADFSMIDPSLSSTETPKPPNAEPAPTSPAPTRRSTRARKAINYNDDKVQAPEPPKVEKPAPRKSRGRVVEPAGHSAPSAVPQPVMIAPSSNAVASSSSAPAPAPAPAPSTSNFNPYLAYYPTPGQAPAPYPYYYYHMPGMMPYPMPGMPAPPPPPQMPRPPPPPPPQVPQQPQPPYADARQPAPKPKRLKAHTVETKTYNIPTVPRDKKGMPMLPLNVGIMTVISLGEVCMREHFHTERYIFPVGYEVTRRYMSTIDPTVDVVYHCTILDGGDGPKFQIVPNDRPDKTVIAGTATGAWSTIVKQANAIRSRQHSNSVSGPDFFGLGQNTIKHLIQQLSNADKLRDYVWQNFTEGGPLGGRHAAVIPALPEEYNSSTPIGAFYPTERDKIQKDRLEERAESGEAPRSHYPPHIMAQARHPQSHSQSPQPQVATDAPGPDVTDTLFADLLRYASETGVHVTAEAYGGQMPTGGE